MTWTDQHDEDDIRRRTLLFERRIREWMAEQEVRDAYDRWCEGLIEPEAPND
jgi:hypothetical protein